MKRARSMSSAVSPSAKRFRRSRYTRYRRLRAWRRGATFSGRRLSRQTDCNVKELGLPRRMITHLPYNAYGLSTVGVGGGVVGQTFRLNSIFDPDFSGGGTKPRYVNQLVTSQLYTRWTVYAVSYDLQISNNTPNVIGQALVRFSGGTAPPALATNTSCFLEREQKMTRWMQIGSAGTHNDTVSFKGFIHINDLFGIPRSVVYEDEQFHGAYNANPTLVGWMQIDMGADPADAASTPAFVWKIRLVYHTRLHFLYPAVPTST